MDQHPSGFWFGDCAKQLGLTGQVKRDHFRNLLAGKSPNGKKQLVKIARNKSKESALSASNKNSKKHRTKDSKSLKSETERAEHVPGIDITFSLPKSVTSLWALLDTQKRHKLEKLIEAGIKQGLQWLTDEIPLARTGKGGCNREFADIAVAIFRHNTARNHNDPQLHYHCVIANVVRQSNGKYSKAGFSCLTPVDEDPWTVDAKQCGKTAA